MFTKWDHRFMEMAQLVSTWASCYQEERKVGAVIVKATTARPQGSAPAWSAASACAKSSGFLPARGMRCATRCTRSRTPSFRRPSWA